MQIETPSTRRDPERCAFCHDRLGPVRPSSECEGCRTVLHDECWTLGAGCPTLGCQYTRARPSHVDAKIPPSPVVFCLVALWFAAVVAFQVSWFFITPTDRSLAQVYVSLTFLGLLAVGTMLSLAALVTVIRRPRWRLSWLTLALVIAAPGSVCLTLPLAKAEWNQPDPMHRGYDLFQAGRYQEALDVYTHALGKSPYPDDRTIWVEIAKCHDRLGHYEFALAAFDKADKLGGLFPYDCLERARCTSRHESSEVATAWLEARATTTQYPIFFQYVIGLYHVGAKRPAQAEAAFLRHMEMAMKVDGSSFDEAGLLIVPPKSTKSSDWGEVDWNAPARLGWVQYNMGRMDDAFRSATMGLSLSQYRYKSKGYYSSPQTEAGDTECRVLRAYVLMSKGDFAAAQVEVDHARRSIEGAPGHYYEKMAIKAQEELDSRTNGQARGGSAR